jgi:hypothetical protein
MKTSIRLTFKQRHPILLGIVSDLHQIAVVACAVMLAGYLTGCTTMSCPPGTRECNLTRTTPNVGAAFMQGYMLAPRPMYFPGITMSPFYQPWGWGW